MTMNGSDPVLSALADLCRPAPPGLSDKIFADWQVVPSRLGEMYVAFTGDGVQFLRTTESLDRDPAAFAAAYRQRFHRPLRATDRAPAGLRPALRGRRGASTVRLDLSGLSEFERNVLNATRQIPEGQTRPYNWVAREAGRPRAVRAVGTVLARNPIPLIVPCHRVVRADGRLGDYMFGAAQKERLLRGEDTNLDEIAEYARQGVLYIGSDTTGVVCYPTCHNARRITPQHRHGFRTLTAARAAGYRPCHSCRPAVADAA
jgi:O-6-methylguanine DNA methyltransferase